MVHYFGEAVFRYRLIVPPEAATGYIGTPTREQYRANVEGQPQDGRTRRSRDRDPVAFREHAL